MNKKVVQYNLNGEYIAKFNSVREASEKLNMGTSNIRKNCNGATVSTKGFIFRYFSSEYKIKIQGVEKKPIENVNNITDDYKHSCSRCDSFSIGMDVYNHFSLNKNYKSNFDNVCKICKIKEKENYLHSLNGLVSSSVTVLKRNVVDKSKFDANGITEFLLSNVDYNNLYNEWVDNNYDKNLKPIISIKEKEKGYISSNIKISNYILDNPLKIGRTKMCQVCGCVKPKTDFYTHNTNPDGYRYECKECAKKQAHEFSLTRDGLICKIYNSQRANSKRRNMDLPTYTKKEFSKWMYEQENFEELYIAWCKTNHDKNKIPSVDRIDDYVGYTFENIQLMTWRENNEKGHYTIKNGLNSKNCRRVNQYSLDGDLIKEFPSIAIASREVDTHSTCINNCLDTPNRYCDGYMWRTNIESEETPIKIDPYVMPKSTRRKPVLKYDLENNFVCEYESITAIVKKYGFDKGSIRRCINGITSSYKGFIWKFK